MTNKTWLLLVAFSCMPACSQKALYTNIQKNQRYECLKLPDSEQKQCLASIDMNYEEYQRQRHELNKNSNKKIPEIPK